MKITLSVFFDNCPTYTNRVLNNATTLLDSQTYIAKYLPSIRRKVLNNLAIVPRTWNVTSSDILLFYDVCIYEASNQGITNRFCSLFDLDDIYRFETSNDLSDYWTAGYASDINYKISCPLLVDFWNSFTSVIMGKSEKSSLRFAHAETIMPFVSLLGLFKDARSLHWNSTQLDQRLWRASQISPFAANVAMILFNCSGIYKVKLLHNEVEMPIPGCGGTLYCPMEQLAVIWKDSLLCPFASMCGTQKTLSEEIFQDIA